MPSLLGSITKVAPINDDEIIEEGIRPETPPPGWVDEDEGEPPHLHEVANEDFLEASRKRRAAQIAMKGQRRYNLALRIVGFVVILNFLLCILPLIDNVYSLSWSTVSGALVKYSINHLSIVDSEGGGGGQSFAPYEHYKAMYQNYNTSFDNEASFVLLQPGNVPSDRDGYCKLVVETQKYASANNENALLDPWCGPQIINALIFLYMQLLFALLCILMWYTLLKGDGDIPPSKKIEYSPPDTDNPQGKFYILTVYHAALLHIICGIFGALSLDFWNRFFMLKYSTTNCGSEVCPNIGILHYITLISTIITFCIALYYRAIGRQNYLYTMRSFMKAAKKGDTFEVLKLSGQGWFLRYIDDLDPDGSGRNALHWASRKGSSTMAQLLVQSGADPRKRDVSGWNAMHYASRYGHIQVMKNLLGSKYGETLVNERESLGAYPLHMCAATGNVDCAMTLINSSGQPNVDSINAFGQTPLMLAASRGGKGAAVLDMLITSGADPNLCDFDGSTAIHYAASTGSEYCIERLIRAAYKASLAPIGGRSKPTVTLQAKHNKYHESAADEALSRNKLKCRDLILANIDLYHIEDNERLKSKVETSSSNIVSSSSQFSLDHGFKSGVLDEEEEFLYQDDDDEKSDVGSIGTADNFTIQGEEFDENEDEYPSDDERRNNDGVVLDSVLRRRLGNNSW